MDFNIQEIIYHYETVKRHNDRLKSMIKKLRFVVCILFILNML